MHRPIATLALTCALTGLAFAHTNVKNPTVKAWMDNMEAISAETKVLGLMARRQTPFDANLANDALRRLSEHSDKVPALFRVAAEDPTSEARPAIWQSWDAYLAEANALQDIASTAAITSPEDLKAVVAELGATCKSCHGTFRD